MHPHSGKLAFGGVMTALAVVLLLLTVSPPATVALAALAGLTAVPLVIEINRRAALLQYVAVTVLALLLIPAWEGKLLYVGFFGYYAIVKSLLEARQMPRAAEWASKLAVFIAAMGVGTLVAVTMLRIPLPSFHPAAWAGLALAAVAVFVLYDIGLTRLISTYIHRLHPTVHRLFRF